MKCPHCSHENKETAVRCKKCARDLSTPPAWLPDWRWHAKTLGIIYVAVTVFYFIVSFVLRKLPAPYQARQIPPEMTPWLQGH